MCTQMFTQVVLYTQTVRFGAGTWCAIFLRYCDMLMWPGWACVWCELLYYISSDTVQWTAGLRRTHTHTHTHTISRIHNLRNHTLTQAGWPTHYQTWALVCVCVFNLSCILRNCDNVIVKNSLIPDSSALMQMKCCFKLF